MKILFIVLSTENEAGSAKSFMRLLYGLRTKGCECTVVLGNNEGIYGRLKNDGFEVYVLPHNANVWYQSNNLLIQFRMYYWMFRFGIKSEKAVHAIIRKFKEDKWDLIHSNTSIINVGFRSAMKLNIPHITHFREYGDLDFDMALPHIKKQIAHPLNYNISITKDIYRHRNLPDDRSRVIYNGICSKDDIRFTEDKLPYFLFAGRVTEKKGVRDLITAYHNYAKRVRTPYKLKIAGQICDQAIKEYSDELMSATKFAEYVEWLGPVEDIEDKMYRASATIIPSYAEGFGRVMPEAMANGSLTIVRATGGLKEQLENGVEETGAEIALSYNTIDELADRMVKVTETNQKEFMPMIMRSQEVVRKLYTTESHVEQVYAFMQEIVANH